MQFVAHSKVHSLSCCGRQIDTPCMCESLMSYAHITGAHQDTFGLSQWGSVSAESLATPIQSGQVLHSDTFTNLKLAWETVRSGIPGNSLPCRTVGAIFYFLSYLSKSVANYWMNDEVWSCFSTMTTHAGAISKKN